MIHEKSKYLSVEMRIHHKQIKIGSVVMMKHSTYAYQTARNVFFILKSPKQTKTDSEKLNFTHSASAH